MTKSRRILFYNWVPFDDDEKRGGGVSVYQKNLIEALATHGWEIDFFSAGIVYSLNRTEQFFERTRNVFADKCRSFHLVNSPILAPGHSAFGQNRVLFEYGTTHELFLDFMAANGPYDVVHFNNIEGIPFTFLDIKSRFPKSLVVFSHHNYFPICPQVNLWHREWIHCTDYDNGRKCVGCLVHQVPLSEVLAANQLSTMLKANGVTSKSPLFGHAFSQRPTIQLLIDINAGSRGKMLRAEPQDLDSRGVSPFAKRRQAAVELLNSCVDMHLAVSKRVARLLVSYGVDAERMQVAYIGTKHAETYAKASKRTEPREEGVLSVCFMGYMRADKGFFFLLDALERVPNGIAQQIRLKFAAKSNGDQNIARRMGDLARKFAGIQHIDGYSHDELPNLLSDVDVGVVPVLWEDNLPQVALEIMSHGVPIITSDRGGAQELGANPEFVFEAGNHEALIRCLSNLASGKVPLASFWDGTLPLLTMAEHVTDLIGRYEQGIAELAAGNVPSRKTKATTRKRLSKGVSGGRADHGQAYLPAETLYAMELNNV